MVGYDDFRRQQAEARRDGRLLGIGVTTYSEICGLGPSQVAGAVGFQGGLWESAIIRVSPSGKVQALIGTSPHGQGEETTFAQLICSELGFPGRGYRNRERRYEPDADGLRHLWQPHHTSLLALRSSKRRVNCGKKGA